MAEIASYFARVQHASDQNKHNYASLKLFLTSKRKLHEVTRQPRSLDSFAFWKAWIRGYESAFKKKKKAVVGMEGNATDSSVLSA